MFNFASWGYTESPVDAGEGQPWLLRASTRPGFGACCPGYHTLYHRDKSVAKGAISIVTVPLLPSH